MQNILPPALTFITGLIICVWSIQRILQTAFLKKDYAKTVAKITEVNTTRQLSDNLKSVVKVEYTIENGGRVTGEINGTTYPSIYKVGDLIAIAYRKEKNSDFIVLERRQVYLYLLFTTIGFATLVFGSIASWQAASIEH